MKGKLTRLYRKKTCMYKKCKGESCVCSHGNKCRLPKLLTFPPTSTASTAKILIPSPHLYKPSTRLGLFHAKSQRMDESNNGMDEHRRPKWKVWEYRHPILVKRFSKFQSQIKSTITGPSQGHHKRAITGHHTHHKSISPYAKDGRWGLYEFWPVVSLVRRRAVCA